MKSCFQTRRFLISFFILAIAVLALPSLVMAIMWKGEAADIGTKAKMADKAAVVLSGVVESVDYATITSKAGKEIPYSQVTIKVEKGYRGVKDGESFSFFIAGGEAPNGHRIIVGGGPSFIPTDRIILFYNGEMYKLVGAVGGSGGVMRIVTEGKEKILLDHAWRPIVGISGISAGSDKTIRCIPNEKDRSKCDRWEETGDLPDTSEDEGESEETVQENIDFDDFETELINLLQENPGRSGGKLDLGEFIEAFEQIIN